MGVRFENFKILTWRHHTPKKHKSYIVKKKIVNHENTAKRNHFAKIRTRDITIVSVSFVFAKLPVEQY